MIDENERTVISPEGPPASGGAETVPATAVLSPGAEAAAMAASDRTQMAVSAECPVCHSANPPGETYCGDCGFLLTAVPGGAVEELSAPQACLTTADGRDLSLNSGRNLVGRANADVLLADPTVSRQHAVVGLEENRCWVEDLGSTNGTKVNGQRLAPNQPRDLADGDELSFGSVALRVALPEGFVAASPPEAAAPEQAAGEDAPASSPARLVAEETGREYSLPIGSASIGRRAANAIAFPTDAYISGRHAEISFDGNQITLTDLGSTNGTVVNDDRAPANTPIALQDGDLVVMGQQRLRVRWEPQAEAPSAEEAAPRVDAPEGDPETPDAPEEPAQA